MAVKELKVIGADRGRLDPRDLLLSMEKNGAQGEPGVQGLLGQEAARRESETSGIPGTPGVMSYILERVRMETR